MSSQDVDFTRRQVRWRLDVFCVLHAYLKVLVECSSILVIPHWLVTCTYPKVLPELACRTSSFFRCASAVTSILRFTWRKKREKKQNHPQKFPPHRPLFSINFLSFMTLHLHPNRTLLLRIPPPPPPTPKESFTSLVTCNGNNNNNINPF